MHGKFDLKREGFCLFNFSDMTSIVTFGSIAAGVAIIVLVSIPLKVPKTPGISRVPPYQRNYEPSFERTTELTPPPPLPEGGTPVGGVGLHDARPAPQSRPLPPKDHFMRVSSDPPRCPFHPGIALVAHHSRPDATDSGSWYCPYCQGYPWGRN